MNTVLQFIRSPRFVASHEQGVLMFVQVYSSPWIILINITVETGQIKETKNIFNQSRMSWSSNKIFHCLLISTVSFYVLLLHLLLQQIFNEDRMQVVYHIIITISSMVKLNTLTFNENINNIMLYNWIVLVVTLFNAHEIELKLHLTCSLVKCIVMGS